MVKPLPAKSVIDQASVSRAFEIYAAVIELAQCVACNAEERTVKVVDSVRKLMPDDSCLRIKGLVLQ